MKCGGLGLGSFGWERGGYLESNFSATTMSPALLKGTTGFHLDFTHNLAMGITGRAKDKGNKRRTLTVLPALERDPSFFK